MLEFYTTPVSSNAQFVILVMLEKGLEWNEHLVDLAGRANLKPDYLAINPEGTVPALVDGDVTLWESTVIARYLDRKYPEPALSPSGAVENAKMDMWFARQAPLANASHNLTWSLAMRPRLVAAGPEAQATAINGIPDPALKARRETIVMDGLESPEVGMAVRYFKRTLELLEDMLEGPFVLGDTLTLADLLLSPYLLRLDQTGLFEAMGGKSGKTGAWYDTMLARESVQKGVIGVMPPPVAEALAAAGKAHAAELQAKLD